MPRGEEMDLCKQNFTEVNLKQQLISTSTEYPYPLLPTTPPVSMLTATTAALVTRDNIWPGIKRSSVLRLSVDSLMWILFKCVVKSDEFKTAVHWSGCYQTPLTPEMKLNELKAALTSCHVSCHGITTTAWLTCVLEPGGHPGIPNPVLLAVAAAVAVAQTKPICAVSGDYHLQHLDTTHCHWLNTGDMGKT